MSYDDYIECKECKKLLPISCFYAHYSYGTKGNPKLYLKIHKTCKKCKAAIRQQKIEGIRDQILQQRIEEQVTSYEPKMVLGWVVRNLKRFGNCYVRRLGRIDIQATQDQVGYKLTVLALQNNDGYILQVKKGERI